MTGKRNAGSPPPTGSAVIRDVARSAGVSSMTVSRVINGQPNVSATTRQRVLTAIEQLAYRPSRSARDLSRGRSRSVTVMTSDTSLYGRAALLRGVEEEARAAGYHVNIGVLDSPHPAAIQAAIDHSCDPSSGGVVVIAFDAAGVRALRAVPPGIPVVAALEINNLKDGRAYPSVALDDRAAAVTATRHLLELGHSTVQHISIPSSTTSSARMQGWRSALRAAGIVPPAPIAAGWGPQSAYEAAQAIAADRAVTAVLCGNDDLALGVIHALRQAGRVIPDDVSVIGFDDAPLAAFYAPPLTTVRLDFAGLGRDCFALLQHLVNPDGPRPAPVAEPPKLIVRETTAAPGR